eukprot:TRINITY_DN186_c0_g1_i8.p2 TRINITY_DN186_c0_g1~~TRINITY_DN186_c0_g1_i8.p2  ORF type:complete len:127 (-),score=2.65 TRINITY_DN186_c0_g1_i8:281-661(-)
MIENSMKESSRQNDREKMPIDIPAVVLWLVESNIGPVQAKAKEVGVIQPLGCSWNSHHWTKTMRMTQNMTLMNSNMVCPVNSSLNAIRSALPQYASWNPGLYRHFTQVAWVSWLLHFARPIHLTGK